MKKNILIIGLVAVVLAGTVIMTSSFKGNETEEVRISVEDITENTKSKEETWQVYLQEKIAEQLLKMESVSNCEINFQIDDTTITKATIILECTEPFDNEKEDSIKEYVAECVGTFEDNISISYK